MVARRTRLAFLDVDAAADALPRIVAIMGEELAWSAAEAKRQHRAALQFLASLGPLDLYPHLQAAMAKF
jgi:glycerol-3-phosphate dehydrogenase